MRPRDFGPLVSRAARAAKPIAAALALSLIATGAARATLSSISVIPDSPVSCDSTIVRVSGAVRTCGNVIATAFTGPITEDVNGVLVRRFDASIVIQDPNPILMMPCPSGNPPYSYGFPAGLLPPGPYVIRATEYLVPFSPDNSLAPYDSTALDFQFVVTLGDSCPPVTPCSLLGFLPADGGVPFPVKETARLLPCTATAPPGGTGCFAIGLESPVPVGGVQVEFTIADETMGPLPAGTFTPLFVETTERSRDFTVSWAANGSTVKAILYSATGATIAPGSGPILRACYGVSSDTREMNFPIIFGRTLVADANGSEIPPCPTIAMIQGWFCVRQSPAGCDLNRDGRSDIRDVILLVRCALAGAGTDACPDTLAARADCNGDALIDIRDVICCVRKILEAGILPPPTDGGGGTPTRIGFMGPATWLDAANGRALIEVAPAPGFAGAQFIVAPGPGIRVRNVSLRSGEALESLQWSPGIDGSARVMLYGTAGAVVPAPPASGVATLPIRIEVEIEPSDGATSPASTLTLLAFSGATWEGVAAPSEMAGPTADVPATAVGAPAVYPARPNPFAGETEISYALPVGTRVSLRLYDVSGRLVRTLVDGARDAGVHHARWDGRNDAGAKVVSGIYFVKFSADGITRSDRILKLR